MRRFTKFITAALLFGAAASLTTSAEAGWGPWPKPNLRIATMQKSLVSPYHARVIITNSAPWSSKACYVRLKVMKSTPVYKYYKIPAIASYGAVGVDIYTGVYQQSPGLVTYAYVDVFNQVAESNEYDNGFTYIAPPW